ncbi:MAG TPA: hypothetical protein V6D08_18980 [Candidatus Obscuribacterales bacterium]
MFESFGRGFKMIGASIKMAWQDRRLLVPSVLTVLTNITFAILIAWQAAQKVPHQGQAPLQQMSESVPTHGMLRHGHFGGSQGMPQLGLNSPLDQSGINQLGAAVTSDTTIIIVLLMMTWWLTNRFLEGVTTALVYSHLTEGRGTGTFSEACKAVFQSLPAIIMLGLVTLIAKRIAGWLRNRRNSGMFGFGFNFLAGIVEVFWTLAGHLILPAIVIEGTSFWGGLKRADKIASGNLLTIGVGEVGVDVICRFTTWIVYLIGISAFGYVWYAKMGWTAPLVVVGALAWASLVVLVTALSIYIRAAFYTCLYVWAIDAEAVQETERVRVKPPEPLAAALA